MITEALYGLGGCRCARGVRLLLCAVTLRAIEASRSIGADPSTGSALSARPPAVAKEGFQRDVIRGSIDRMSEKLNVT